MWAERQHHGRPGSVEEQCGQTLWGNRRLHDLLFSYPRLQLLAAQKGLSDLQEEVPLCMSGELLFNWKTAVNARQNDFSQWVSGAAMLMVVMLLFYSTNGSPPATSPPVPSAEKPSSNSRQLFLQNITSWKAFDNHPCCCLMFLTQHHRWWWSLSIMTNAGLDSQVEVAANPAKC